MNDPLPTTPSKCCDDGLCGEPFHRQILDPVTETVHAPGMEIDQDGTVRRRSYGVRPEDFLG